MNSCGFSFSVIYVIAGTGVKMFVLKTGKKEGSDFKIILARAVWRSFLEGPVPNLRKRMDSISDSSTADSDQLRSCLQLRQKLPAAQ